jgi:peptidoglycan/xylan/chitin deacetylase (PgdA/CDA1 family)
MTRWGPDAKAAAVSITFDNLGEAMDLAIGAWPEHEPVGHHYSVRQVLPKVLATLDDLGVRCTYFAEGWSADVYPDALHDLAAAGHEIGYHGWRHEHWPRIDSRELEAELILRGTRKMAEHGITVRGFRPPGGVMTAWTLELMRAHGLSYISPAGTRAGILDGTIAALPFRWKAIDAYYFFEAFAPLRRALGDPEGVLAPERFTSELDRTLQTLIAENGYLSLLFHPFLLNQPERLDAMRHIIATVLDHDDIWCAPCIDHATWMLEVSPEKAAAPELDERSWQ